jgi:hypothetical protein
MIDCGRLRGRRGEREQAERLEKRWNGSRERMGIGEERYLFTEYSVLWKITR